MSVASWVIFVVVCAFTTWLLIDTIVWVIKRVKAKNKQKSENNDVDKVNE